MSKSAPDNPVRNKDVKGKSTGTGTEGNPKGKTGRDKARTGHPPRGEEPQEHDLLRAPIAGILSWVLPGLGHFLIGDRTRGLILLTVITVTFWSGIAIGGVRDTIDTKQRKLWFTAQMCAGGNALVAYTWNTSQRKSDAVKGIRANPAHWAHIEIGVHYTGVAGLLNILVIFDAIGRASTPGRKRSSDQGGAP
ncbi:MAG: DUF6677 family protein [Planctomycetota bacterium]